VRDGQTALRGQLAELFMGKTHDYRMRIIIKRPKAVSTEIFPMSSKTAVSLKEQTVAQPPRSASRFWLGCRQTRSNLARAHATGWIKAYSGTTLKR
jgi:hypothetical protein